MLPNLSELESSEAWGMRWKSPTFYTKVLVLSAQLMRVCSSFLYPLKNPNLHLGHMRSLLPPWNTGILTKTGSFLFLCSKYLYINHFGSRVLQQIQCSVCIQRSSEVLGCGSRLDVLSGQALRPPLTQFNKSSISLMLFICWASRSHFTSEWDQVLKIVNWKLVLEGTGV